MKIVENTDEKLVLSSRPWAFATLAWMCGLGMIVQGVFEPIDDAEGRWMLMVWVANGLLLCWLAWRYLPFITVEFNRARGQMLHQSHRLISPGWFKLDLDQIQRARLEAQWSDDARTTRVVLEIDGDVVPLEYATGTRDHDDVVEAINEWLTRPT